MLRHNHLHAMVVSGSCSDIDAVLDCIDRLGHLVRTVRLLYSSEQQSVLRCCLLPAESKSIACITKLIPECLEQSCLRNLLCSDPRVGVFGCPGNKGCSYREAYGRDLWTERDGGGYGSRNCGGG